MRASFLSPSQEVELSSFSTLDPEMEGEAPGGEVPIKISLSYVVVMRKI
jgi:hypothetical protein